jgi:uncharacterized protein YbaP (TraB family)
MIRAIASAARVCFVVATLLAAIPAAAQTPPETRHFLWEVQSMTNRAWLFGTMHAGKKEWYPLPDAVERAFAESTVLVVEADITDEEAMAKTISTMAYAPPDDLTKHVPPADYERLKALLDKHRIPEGRVKRMKPFPAASVILFSDWERQGFFPTYGIDGYLLNKGRAMRKTIVEIEGVEAQAKLVDSLTEEEQREAFAGALTAVESGLTGEQIDGMVKAWQSGDAFLMLEVARRYNEKIPGAGAIEEKFIWSRHEAMVKKIEEWLNKSDKKYFIALGSLHLVGQRGLVELLRKRGYLVRQK